ANLVSNLVVGGECTVLRHLSALVNLVLPVLVVPAGIGNDFARSLGLLRVRDSLESWRKFRSGSGNLRIVDLGLITPLIVEQRAACSESAEGSPPVVDRGSVVYFSCAAGVALDGEISRRANALPRRRRAPGGYAFPLPS